MIVLRSEKLMDAERSLKEFFPESVKVYGCLFHINRGKPHKLEVIVDSWPDFRVIICKPKIQGTKDREGDFNIHSVYSKDKDSLKTLLQTAGIINWDVFTLLAGVDINHLRVVQEVADEKGIPSRAQTVMHVFILEDFSHVNVRKSLTGCTVRPLTSDHAELVDSTWKCGGDRNSYNTVSNYISNYPSFCVMREGDTQPVSWILLHQHCALGLLYTLPEHRGRGYAKLLVSIMAEHLLKQGCPVYCFIEEGNSASLRLFTSLGFKEKPSYQAVWYELNKRAVS
ncbi:glycine N-acyltransferase-like protein 3 [Chanos chanos]|uniref:Glycine N-acyltransferase-like protein n=1 Tax=Chanos chanos TaxID=29144 RepID=A0A6J2V9P2_CHACN|nr:glycine N-acyltransferase-like protein 3 [Chanos chanos]